jgi:hypothetical protein
VDVSLHDPSFAAGSRATREAMAWGWPPGRRASRRHGREPEPATCQCARHGPPTASPGGSSAPASRWSLAPLRSSGPLRSSCRRSVGGSGDTGPCSR